MSDITDVPHAVAVIDDMGGLLAAAADPGGFFARLIDYIDGHHHSMLELRAYLAEHNTTIGEITQLISDVALDGVEPLGPGLPFSKTVGVAIRYLYLRRFPAAAIARILNIDAAVVERWFEHRRTGQDGETDVIFLHGEGKSPTEIARLLHISRTTVDGLLRRSNLEPHTTRPLGQREEIVMMRQKGASYADIKEKLGVNTSQVRNALRKAASRGALPHYNDGWKSRSV